jgi:hypothetical protein
VESLQGLGFGVRGSGFGVRGSGFGVRGLGLSGFGVRGSGFGVRRSGLSGFGVRGSGFGVRGSGLGVRGGPLRSSDVVVKLEPDPLLYVYGDLVFEDLGGLDDRGFGSVLRRSRQLNDRLLVRHGTPFKSGLGIIKLSLGLSRHAHAPFEQGLDIARIDGDAPLGEDGV